MNGNTDTILHEALAAAKKEGAEVKLIRLSDYRLEPCDACARCRQTKSCVKEDDWGKLYEEILQSDGLILGSPSYFQGVSAQMKTFIDRIGFLSLARKDFAGKVGGVIGVARRSGLAPVCNQMITFVTATRMIVPSGRRVFAVAREQGEVLKDQEALDSARYLGKMMAKTVMATQSLRNS